MHSQDGVWNRRGGAGLGKAGRGTARQGEAGRGWAGQGRAGQGKDGLGDAPAGASEAQVWGGSAMSDWRGCYSEGWTDIVPEAFAHPAKFSRALIRRIYTHASEEGWLQAGERVIDPFGGVALGAIDAMRHGLHWYGVELEPRFWQLGWQNIDQWDERYSAMPRWGTATLLLGDSRQLAAMVGGADGVVSSPPFCDNGMGDTRFGGGLKDKTVVANSKTGGGGLTDYGTTSGNLGNMRGGDFWPAARQIVDQVYAVLKPGGVAIWVVKAFVRNKAIVDFPGQWRQMCEAAGFETLHEHRAWLVEERGAQHTLDNGVERRKVERKSFFRRLAEAKGSPAIDWETVLCMRKGIRNATRP